MGAKGLSLDTASSLDLKRSTLEAYKHTEFNSRRLQRKHAKDKSIQAEENER